MAVGVVEVEDAVARKDRRSGHDTMTTTMRDTVMAAIMTRDTAMTMDTADTMGMEAEVDTATMDGVAEAVVDLAAEVADEVVGVVVVVGVAILPPKVGPETGLLPMRMPELRKKKVLQLQTQRMPPTIHLRWSKHRTAVAVTAAEAVSDVAEVVGGAEEEELMLSA